MTAPENQGSESQSQEGADLPQVDELTMLKSRARLMGINFSNNIGVEALREKIRAKTENEADTTNNDGEPLPAATAAPVAAAPAFAPVNPLADSSPGVTLDKPGRKLTPRQFLQNREMKLIRCRITCLDPKKKDLQGEILTVANGILGTVRKFVPFGEATDEGWHVPFIIFKMMDERKFLNIRTTKDKRTGQLKVESVWAKEFALEVLPQLDERQLATLAAAQAASGAV